MQEVRHFQPSTVSRRVSVVVGFYRTRVIDQILPQSPADYLRRRNVPPESPTLGLSHLQFEAQLSAARTSGNTRDFPLVSMPGLLELRIFEACGANITDLGEERGHRAARSTWPPRASPRQTEATVRHAAIPKRPPQGVPSREGVPGMAGARPTAVR